MVPRSPIQGLTRLLLDMRKMLTCSVAVGYVYLRFLSLGIWISFTVFGYCQESLTRQEFNGRRFVWTEVTLVAYQSSHPTCFQALIVCQCISNVIVSGTVIAFTRTPSSKSNNRYVLLLPIHGQYIAHRIVSGGRLMCLLETGLL